MKFEKSTLDEIKSRLDLATVIEQDTGQTLKKVGESFRCACPLHNGTSENNFSVYGPTWRCFSDGCGSGDVFDFMMKYHGWNFEIAVRECARLAGIKLGPMQHPVALRREPVDKPPVVTPDRIENPPPQSWQDTVSDIVVDCQKNLWLPENYDPREWLNKRGLKDSTLQAFQVGYNPTTKKMYGHYVYGGIIIPHFEWSTLTLWGVKIRLNQDGKRAWLNNWKRKNPNKDSDLVKIPKYMAIAGSKQNLFNADSLQGHQYAFVCEGEFDTMLGEQEFGHLAATITLGSATSELGDVWVKYLLPIRRFYLGLDGDEAGKGGARKWAKLVGKRAYEVDMPPGQDLTDLWKAGVNLQNLVKKYLPSV